VPRSVVIAAIAAASLALVPGCGASRGARSSATSGGSSTTASPQPGDAVVVRVVDGDTIRARVGGAADERVRLIGIDTPESVKPNTPVQCFGREASARTKALLPPGTPVRLVRDVEARDRYGRLLAYVYRRADGLFVNLALVEDGYAVPYTFPPNVAHADEFVAAARAAREAGRGLWSGCADDDIPDHGTEP
jgi:micrococcal nuclease